MNFLLLDKTVEEFTYKTQAGGASSFVNALGQIIFLIVVFAVIIFLAFFSTKFIARTKMQSMSGKNINIVESINLGLGLSLYLIKAGTQYFLVSATKEKIELISEINSDDIKEIENNNEISFEKIMKDCLNKFKQTKK